MTERWVEAIWKAHPGVSLANAEGLPQYEAAVRALPVDDARRLALLDVVQTFMAAPRSRHVIPGWQTRRGFAARAAAYEAAADESLDALAAQLVPVVEAAGARFDAILTTTSTGNLMPGLGYRMARRLGAAAPPGCLVLDLGNVGCTGSVKALNLARLLEPSVADALVVSVEVPTTLLDLQATDVEAWRGNCTFGDGAAAAWISTRPGRGPLRLRLGPITYVQQASAGLDLIRWDHDDYYRFASASEESFDHAVKGLVTEALAGARPGWADTPFWAVHPAGVALLMRLSKKLGLPRGALSASVEHFQRHSNMSSASILHVISDVAQAAPAGARIALLTMGAGFNVLFGDLHKEA